MERIVLFLDYANVNRAAGERGWRLDYADLLEYVSDGRFLVEAHGYVPINPRCEHRGDRDIEDLWQAGYLVHTKLGTLAGGTYRCNFAVEIAMDMLKALFQVKPDIMVLASGDADFVPLIQESRQAGVRVEVAAFPQSAGAEIRLKCSGFIDLAVYVCNALAAQRGQEEVRAEERYQKLLRSQQRESEEQETVDEGASLPQSRRKKADKRVEAAVRPSGSASSAGTDQERPEPELSKRQADEDAALADRPVPDRSTSLARADVFETLDL
ncbi:MAG TPA: NYN domain-containing protein [Ktedonobacteraceae bacterium]|jgi:uncharacterized LabA/DUF88 family protein